MPQREKRIRSFGVGFFFCFAKSFPRVYVFNYLGSSTACGFLYFLRPIFLDAKLPARSFLGLAKGGCLPPSGTQILGLNAGFRLNIEGPGKRANLSLKASKTIGRRKSISNVEDLYLQVCRPGKGPETESARELCLLSEVFAEEIRKIHILYLEVEILNL